MPLLFLLVFFVFIGWIGYLAYLNPHSTALRLTQGNAYEVSVVALLLCAMAIGGGILLGVTAIRRSRDFFSRRAERRRCETETRVLALRLEAINAVLTSRHREALTLFKKMLALSPQHLEALLQLGNLYRAEKNYTEAIRLHKMAQHIETRNVEVLLALAQDMQEAERDDEAVGMLHQVLEIETRSLSIHMRIREIHTRNKQWEQAHAIQERLMKLSLDASSRAQEQIVLLGLKYEIGIASVDHPVRARRYFKEALKIDRAFLPPYVGLAQIYRRQGKVEWAVRLLSRGYTMTRQILLLHVLEDLCIEVGMPERILRVYERALKRFPDDIPLKFYLGKLYYRMEMIEEAYRVLSEVEYQVEDFPDLYKILGNIHMRQGKMQKAVAAFKRALNLKKRVVVDYDCTACGHQTTAWSGRCVQCGRWDGYRHAPMTGASFRTDAQFTPY